MEIYEYKMKETFSMNLKIFPKCSDTAVEKTWAYG